MKKVSKKVYMVIATIVVFIFAMFLIEVAYNNGVSDGELTGYYAGRKEGYAAGYDDGNWDGKLEGRDMHRDVMNNVLKWSGDTGNYFEREIDGKTYRVEVMVVEE